MRNAIDLSYRETQQTLAIASVCISAPLLLLMLLSRNIKLNKDKTEDSESSEEQPRPEEVPQAEKKA